MGLVEMSGARKCVNESVRSVLRCCLHLILFSSPLPLCLPLSPASVICAPPEIRGFSTPATLVWSGSSSRLPSSRLSISYHGFPIFFQVYPESSVGSPGFISLPHRRRRCVFYLHVDLFHQFWTSFSIRLDFVFEDFYSDLCNVKRDNQLWWRSNNSKKTREPRRGKLDFFCFYFYQNFTCAVLIAVYVSSRRDECCCVRLLVFLKKKNQSPYMLCETMAGAPESRRLLLSAWFLFLSFFPIFFFAHFIFIFWFLFLLGIDSHTHRRFEGGHLISCAS